MNCTNLVIIEVSGGVAEISHAHDETVDVRIIDWDSWNGSAECPWCHKVNHAHGMLKCEYCGFPCDNKASMLDFIMDSLNPKIGEEDHPL